MVVSVIAGLSEERRNDLTARRTRMERGALLAPMLPAGTVDPQCCLNPGEESLSDVVDAAIYLVGLIRVRDHVGDRVSRIIQPCGYRGSRVAHRFVLSLSLPIAARSKTMRSQVTAGDGAREKCAASRKYRPSTGSPARSSMWARPS